MSVLLVLFLDNFCSVDLHLPAISLVSPDSLLIVADKDEGSYPDLRTHISLTLESLKISAQWSSIRAMNRTLSLIDFYQLKEFISGFSKISINCSTGYLPGMMALDLACHLLNRQVEFIYLRRSDNNTWYNKNYTRFQTYPPDYRFLKPIHWDFIVTIDHLFSDKSDIRFKELVEVGDKIHLFDGIQGVEWLYNPTARKRLHDLIEPLLKYGLMNQEGRTRRSTYSLSNE